MAAEEGEIFTMTVETEILGTYRSKESTRIRPKFFNPMKLEHLCFDVISKMLVELELQATHRNQNKTEVQQYFLRMMPGVLQKKLVDKSATDNYSTAKDMLSTLSGLPPLQVAVNYLDLLKHYHGSDWCYKPGHWRWGNGSEWTMNVDKCHQLFRIFQDGDISSFNRISLCAFQDALRLSKMPSVFARAHNLIDITILCGATNHILRILGIHCPLLRKLNIYGSESVTDTGLFNLILRRPKISSSASNPCAKTIETIEIFRTMVTAVGCELVCNRMKIGYLLQFLPNNRIFRINGYSHDFLHYSNYSYDNTVNSLNELPCSEELKTTVDNVLRVCPEISRDLTYVWDYYKPTKASGRFCLRKKDSMILKAMLTVEGNFVTELVLVWDTIGTWDWNWGSPPAVASLAIRLPNLKSLKSRLIGSWTIEDVDFFPALQYAEVWVGEHNTLLSLLAFSPSLVTLDCRHIGDDVSLDDEILMACLDKNSGMTKTIADFNIRPTLLTSASVLNLIQRCPNLIRIGDLENWNINSAEIKVLNNYLESINSMCVLNVCSFPPTTRSTLTI